MRHPIRTLSLPAILLAGVQTLEAEPPSSRLRAPELRAIARGIPRPRARTGTVTFITGTGLRAGNGNSFGIDGQGRRSLRMTSG